MPPERQSRERRQAARRAARAAGGAGGAVPPETNGDGAPASVGLGPDAAPPETVGRSDTVLGPPARPVAGESARTDDPDLLDDELSADDDGELAAEEAYEASASPVGSRAAPRADDDERRGRVMAFLVSVIAELKRVQWPTRAALTSLTGVVLGFVLIAGGYLGLLDAIFSRLIQAIL